MPERIDFIRVPEMSDQDIKKGDRVTWKAEVVARARTGAIHATDPVNVREGDRFYVVGVENGKAKLRTPAQTEMTMSVDLLEKAA